MNRVSLTGRLVRDPELRATSTGKDIVNYSIAVQLDKDTTDFINCTTFNESAKALHKYCHKGDLLGIEGMLRTNQYTDKNDNKHTMTYVLTNKVEFLSTKKEQTTEQVPSINKDEVVVDSSELPF